MLGYPSNIMRDQQYARFYNTIDQITTSHFRNPCPFPIAQSINNDNSIVDNHTITTMTATFSFENFKQTVTVSLTQPIVSSYQSNTRRQQQNCSIQSNCVKTCSHSWRCNQITITYIMGGNSIRTPISIIIWPRSYSKH